MSNATDSSTGCFRDMKNKDDKAIPKNRSLTVMIKFSKMPLNVMSDLYNQNSDVTYNILER